jgi:hypothetical protein
VSFLRELLESLGLRKRTAPQVGLRPHRDVVVPLGIDATHDRVVDACARALGANVYVDDRSAHLIEAGFGLVNAERVRASLESQDATHTIVHIEAQYRAGLERPPSSRNVDALANSLSSQA